MAKKVQKWFAPSERKLGWSKDDSQTKRRKIALASRKGDLLATARALQSLANVTKDPETKQKSAIDAQYFYRLHRQKRNKKK